MYRCFKPHIFVEDYGTTIMPFSHRQGLAKLQCASLLGRRNQVLLADRKCKLCSENNVEDEINFVLHCPLYDDLREECTTFI